MIFEQKLASVKSIIVDAIQLSRNYNPSQEISLQDTIVDFETHYPYHWIPPPPSTFKINVDDSAGNQHVAIAIVRDYTGSFIQGETKDLQACSPEEVEAMAFYMGSD